MGNAALVGRKRWFFVPPGNNFWSRKPISTWFDSDYAKMPKPLFQCVQEPGDVIYVPEVYGHAVLNVEDSVAVATEVVVKSTGQQGLQDLGLFGDDQQEQGYQQGPGEDQYGEDE